MYGELPAVKKISPQKARAIIEYQLDRKAALDERDYGRFYAEHSDGSITAIDNIHGDCLVEKFKSRSAARRWLLACA